MRRVSPSLGVGLLLTSLVGAGAPGCSSVERPATDGTGGATAQGTGGAGGPGPDTSCLDGSDGCVWSCAVGPEMGTGDSPFPSCDGEGKLQCPAGSQRLSSCALGSCARDIRRCCDAATGQIAPQPCKADGSRDVCPAGTALGYCIPEGLPVSMCFQLDRQPCASMDLECHSATTTCECLMQGNGSLVWECKIYIP